MEFTSTREILTGVLEEDRIQKISSAYEKRTRELGLIYSLIQIFIDQDRSLQDLFSTIVLAIPSAMQFPADCQVKISYGSDSAQTRFFQTRQKMLTEEIQLSTGNPLVINVVYLSEHQNKDTGPFEKEEYLLIAFIASQLAACIERKNHADTIEKKLLESEINYQRSEKILMLNPVPMILFNRDLEVTTFNHAMTELSGYSPDILSSLKLSDFTITQREGATVPEVLQTKKSGSGTLTVDFPAGTKYLDYYYIPIPDKTGEINDIIDVLLDRTSQRQAIEDIIAISKDAKLGNLNSRINTKNHSGDFQRICSEINATLDAILLPIAEGNRVLTRIAEGNIDELVTRQYQGDHELMKDAVNTIATNLQKFKNELNVLTDEAKSGFLHARADATVFKGAYADIITGLNETLDAIITPIDLAMKVCNKYADRDFTARISISGTDGGEILTFKQALNNIGIQISDSILLILNEIEQIASNVEETNTTTQEVASGANQVAQTAQVISVNTEKGENGISQMITAMEDFSRTIAEVTTNIEDVSRVATEAEDASIEGEKRAQEADTGMQQILVSSQEVNKIISDIQVQMGEIGKIVNLITDIASQTNLLALNAAIEAARAGDAGRGFAVVAAEVKALAQQSRASAGNIDEMIGKLQENGTRAAEAMTKSDAAVNDGTTTIAKAIESFNQIVQYVEQIGKRVSDVASAAEEQAAVIEEITASSSDLGEQIHQTAREAAEIASFSEESAAAVDQISHVISDISMSIEKLSKEMGNFKIN